MAIRMNQLRWITIENQIMTACAPVQDGEFLRLFVAAQHDGKWDWRVWHTQRGEDFRFGIAPTVSDAVEAAAIAAGQLARELTPFPTAFTLRPSATTDTMRFEAPRPYPSSTSEKILAAFHAACDQSDMAVGNALLRILDTMAKQRPMHDDARKRRNMEQLAAAYVRRWDLVHRNDD
jgi:hypothetical protein